MTSERWLRVKALFEAALAQPPESRAAFLEAACEEEALREEVVSLLEAAGEAGPVDRLEEAWARPLAEAREAAADPPDRPVAEPSAGRQIGPYQVVHVLGRGGMGTVYLAERADGQFEQRVALKLAHEGLNSQSLRDRFLAERRVLARLQHPGIARLLDGGLTEDGRPYFAMELVEGERIDAYCDTHRLGIVERLRLFGQVCEAVHHAHQHLVIHRDLKPSNILVTQGGEPHVKLLDFGIAKLIEEADSEAPTQTTERVLTPEYAAPEQIRGAPVSTATDVYSLGVVLFELLTGHRPYQVRTLSPGELERVICDTEPPRPSTAVVSSTAPHGDGPGKAITPAAISRARSTVPDTLVRRLSGDLDTIVLKALAKEPGRRYASAEAFLDDIQRHLDGLPVKARPPTMRYRARKFVQRNALGVGLVALVMLALALGLVGTAWQARVAAAERDTARVEAEKSQQMTAYLLGLFENADPLNAHADSVTAREILEEGVRGIDMELGGQPEVQAALLDAIGRVNASLARFVEAESLTQRAYEMRQQLYEGPHPDLAASLKNLARLRHEEAAYGQADSLYRAALAMQEQLLGEAHPDVAATRADLGEVALDDGKLDEAEALYRQALAIRRASLDPDHPDLAASLNRLGIVLYHKNDLEAAEAHLREALAIRQRTLDPAHPDLASSFNNLAVLLDQQGNQGEAEEMYRESLARRQKRFGPDHPSLATGLNNLGYFFYEQGDYDEAESYYLQALAIDRTALGEDHPRVAIRLTNLAQLYLAKEDYEQAATFNREALALRRAQFSEPHPDVAVSLTNLGGVYHSQGDVDRAEPLYREALAIRREVLPPEHPSTAIVESHLGDVLSVQGKLAEAETLLLDAYASLQSTLGEDHHRTSGTRARLVRLYEAWGRPDEAARYRPTE